MSRIVSLRFDYGLFEVDSIFQAFQSRIHFQNHVQNENTGSFASKGSIREWVFLLFG